MFPRRRLLYTNNNNNSKLNKQGSNTCIIEPIQLYNYYSELPIATAYAATFVRILP